MEDAEYKHSRIRQRIDHYLDKKVEQFTAKSVARYASHDPALAERIQWELTRRAELGKQLDIYEPLRWVAIQTGLSFVMGAAIKAFSEKKVAVPALWTLGISTVLINSIQLVRLLPRYRAGLRGGLDVAFKMHNQELPYASVCDVAPRSTATTNNAWVSKISNASLNTMEITR